MRRRALPRRYGHAAPRYVLRDTAGRYDVGLDRLCVCGHTKGQHAAGKGTSAHECLAGVFDDADPCACEKFKAAKRG